MNLRYDPSVQSLRQSLSLHRSLLSLMPSPRTEDQIIRLVVDCIYEHFPDFRCSFAKITERGDAQIVYSRQKEMQASLSGKVFKMTGMIGLADSFRGGIAHVANDIRLSEAMAPQLAELIQFGAHLARVDVPIPDYDGNTCLLTVTYPTPIEWEESTIELLRTVAESVGLLLRDARNREKLLQSEELFREFAENVPAVVWMTAIPENRIVYVSPLYREIWGRDPQHLYDNRSSLLDTIHPDDRARVAHAFERQLSEKYEQEYRVVRPNGEIRWVKDRGFLIYGADGKQRRVVGIAEDITPLREAEHRLEASRAQVASNAKFAALGEMASGIAHEINNPLAVIHGLAVQLQELLLRETNLSPMVPESLASMEKMSNRIATIVKGLRTFSRTNAGDTMLPVDLNAVVRETAAMCEPKFRSAGIPLALQLSSASARVRCRSAEISQVMLNLVNNAFDAVMAAGKGSVSVSVSAGEGKARLVVEDSGIGIPPEAHERIFQPFFTTKEVGKGTGLGLSISKGLIEAHGGVLFLDANVKITRLVVELPLGT